MKFLIKKGKHFEKKPFFKLTFKDELRFTASFDKNCLYSQINTDSQDLNKLIGLSDNYSHMKDSARIGWRCMNNNTIELWSYIHCEGKLDMKYLVNIEPNETFNGSIIMFENVYLIDVTIKGKMTSQSFNRTSKWNFIRYILKPYFGGNNKAPHDMNIQVKLN